MRGIKKHIKSDEYGISSFFLNQTYFKYIYLVNNSSNAEYLSEYQNK